MEFELRRQVQGAQDSGMSLRLLFHRHRFETHFVPGHIYLCPHPPSQTEDHGGQHRASHLSPRPMGLLRQCTGRLGLQETIRARQRSREAHSGGGRHHPRRGQQTSDGAHRDTGALGPLRGQWRSHPIDREAPGCQRWSPSASRPCCLCLACRLASTPTPRRALSQT